MGSARLQLIVITLCVILGCLASTPIAAQDYRVLIGTAPGSTFDLAGRLISRHMANTYLASPTSCLKICRVLAV